jgi:hypothetical protein
MTSGDDARVYPRTHLPVLDADEVDRLSGVGGPPGEVPNQSRRPPRSGMALASGLQPSRFA